MLTLCRELPLSLPISIDANLAVKKITANLAVKTVKKNVFRSTFSRDPVYQKNSAKNIGKLCIWAKNILITTKLALSPLALDYLVFYSWRPKAIKLDVLE